MGGRDLFGCPARTPDAGFRGRALHFDRHRKARVVIRAGAFVNCIDGRHREFRMRPFLQFRLGIAPEFSRARGPLSVVHGTTAGNIVELAAPAVEIGKPTQGQTDGIVNYSLPLSLCPVSGLDELKLIIR